LSWLFQKHADFILINYLTRCYLSQPFTFFASILEDRLDVVIFCLLAHTKSVSNNFTKLSFEYTKFLYTETSALCNLRHQLISLIVSIFKGQQETSQNNSIVNIFYLWALKEVK